MSSIFGFYLFNIEVQAAQITQNGNEIIVDMAKAGRGAMKRDQVAPTLKRLCRETTQSIVILFTNSNKVSEGDFMLIGNAIAEGYAENVNVRTITVHVRREGVDANGLNQTLSI